MQDQIFQLQYAMDTFYFLVCGALVMWMAAGFAMLEAGLVRTKNTTEILTKNVALFSISCIMYLVVGYSIMYGGEIFLTGIEGGDTLVKDALASSAENGFDGDSVYAGPSDFFFQVVFVATAMSIVSGAVAERMRLWPFLAFAVVMTAVIYPLEGSWTWGGNAVFGLYSLGDDFGFSDFAGSGIVHMAGAAAALAGVLLLGARKGKYTECCRNGIPQYQCSGSRRSRRGTDHFTAEVRKNRPDNDLERRARRARRHYGGTFDAQCIGSDINRCRWRRDCCLFHSIAGQIKN